jgi:DNA-binding NarL/FixJ family response regulator
MTALIIDDERPARVELRRLLAAHPEIEVLAEAENATVALAQALSIPVIASGGLSNMADIEALCEVEDEGVEGVICGRAIYTGDLDFAAGQARADELNG